jgi:hypothetical protein
MTQKFDKQQFTSSASKKATAETKVSSNAKDGTTRNRFLYWNQLSESPNNQDSTNLLPGVTGGIADVYHVLKRIFYGVFRILYGLAKVCVISISRIRRRFIK